MRMLAAIFFLLLCAVAPAGAASNDAVAPVPLTTPGLGPVIAPAPTSEYGRGYEPEAPPPVAQPLPPPVITSPVTGYGTGGMQQPPGAPLNPPYIGRPFTVGH